VLLAPDTEEIQRLSGRLAERITKFLQRRGLGPESDSQESILVSDFQEPSTRAVPEGSPAQWFKGLRHQIPYGFGIARLEIFAALAVAQDAILEGIGFELFLPIYFIHLERVVPIS
jgi:hypothetical protein